MEGLAAMCTRKVEGSVRSNSAYCTGSRGHRARHHRYTAEELGDSNINHSIDRCPITLHCDAVWLKVEALKGGRLRGSIIYAAPYIPSGPHTVPTSVFLRNTLRPWDVT